MISAHPRLSRLCLSALLCIPAATSAAADPVPPTVPTPPPPAGPLPVPYPDAPQPPVPECPYSLCPKAAATLQFAGGASTIEVESFSWGSGAAGDAEPVQSVIPRAQVRTPRDSASGLATGKRMHKPMTMSRGSVDVTMPEGVCVAGARYPAVTLRSGDQSYEMQDVTIASCTPIATAKGKKDKAKLEYMVVKMETVLISG